MHTQNIRTVFREYYPVKVIHPEPGAVVQRPNGSVLGVMIDDSHIQMIDRSEDLRVYMDRKRFASSGGYNLPSLDDLAAAGVEFDIVPNRLPE